MEIRPALRHDQLNHASHDQEPNSTQTGSQSDYEQDRKNNLGERIEQRHRHGRGEIVRRVKDMQLEFVLEQEDCSRRKRQETVPLG